ncbi:MAG TPA: prepilin-type N-terminal cleavage/methylation domain-containing protein [Patescibacteria group bacterium]|nr:prepilin-type N-terminal cleavage/methylation domain-containing protein [Candidatus Saccharimonadales bacterium]HSX46454.1 prepilin-type N-terminal cleavage/methylation domain-containing protein [Patescibacteria group bacterium]
MLQKLKNRDQGFTIIEVLIVLAIAGLILLIVFLAVPALQRNQRNTARRDEAGRIGTTVNNFVSNNQGKLPGCNNSSCSAPTVALWATDCPKLLTDAGTLGQYSAITCDTAGTLGTAAATKYSIATGAIGADPFSAFTNKQDGLLLDLKAECLTNNTTQGGTNREAALMYTTESSSGAPITACINVQ